MDTKLCGTSSHGTNLIRVLLLCAIAVLATSCGRAQAVPPIPIDSVMQAIREYGHPSEPSLPASKRTNPSWTTLKSDDPDELDGPYQDHITADVTQRKFDQLEKEAQRIRADKSRLKGGVWKLYAFYEGASKPSGGDRAADSDWNAHFDSIKQWIAAYPHSATAHIALANSYIGYAWAARGEGYANTVSESGWNLFGQRITVAESALMDAARLNEKCPYWYEAMQNVALAQGWEKQQARELLDQAASFEPAYYHFYREYANFLLPKWYGEEGETQEFAEEISKRLGEPEGSIIYFEISSLLACQCDTARNSLAGMSWARIRQGYSQLQRIYGTSNLKMNRFAYMSFLENDKSSARETFLVLGDSWNQRVWQSSETFQLAKNWASSQ